jgi:hypothetical protein
MPENKVVFPVINTLTTNINTKVLTPDQRTLARPFKYDPGSSGGQFNINTLGIGYDKEDSEDDFEEGSPETQEPEKPSDGGDDKFTEGDTGGHGGRFDISRLGLGHESDEGEEDEFGEGFPEDVDEWEKQRPNELQAGGRGGRVTRSRLGIGHESDSGEEDEFGEGLPDDVDTWEETWPQEWLIDTSSLSSDFNINLLEQNNLLEQYN